MAILNRTFSFYSLAIIFLILICKNTQASEDDLDQRLSFSQKMGGPTLKFLYCYSCGYRKMFDQYVTIIKEEYPEIIVEGSPYDPPDIYMFLAKLIGLGKMLVIICILGGVNIFEYINQATPSFWDWCIENKLYSCMMIFFLCNLFEGQLIQSGAFEISFNDVPVWSKLETGRIPQPSELFGIIKNQLQFTKKLEINNGFAK